LDFVHSPAGFDALYLPFLAPLMQCQTCNNQHQFSAGGRPGDNELSQSIRLSLLLRTAPAGS